MRGTLSRESVKWTFVVLATIVFLAASLLYYVPEGEVTVFSYEISVSDDYYFIRIKGSPRIEIKDIVYKVLDERGKVAEVIDQNGKSMQLAGELRDIKFNSTKSSQSRSHYHGFLSDRWYPDHHSWENNQTQHLRYSSRIMPIHIASADILDENDYFHIRSSSIGGVVKEGYRLILRDRSKGKVVLSVRFPAPLKPIETEVIVETDDIVIRILDVEPRVLSSVHWSMYTVDDDQIQGSLRDIQFDGSDFRSANKSGFPNVTYLEHYYADDLFHGAQHSSFDQNPRLFLSFLDANDNGWFDQNDEMHIRPSVAGGIADINTTFRLEYLPWVNGSITSRYISLRYNEATTEINWSVAALTDAYAITIHKVDNYPLNDVRMRWTDNDLQFKPPDHNSQYEWHPKLNKIKYQEEEYQRALNASNDTAVSSGWFYAGYYGPVGAKVWTNTTLHFSYYDHDSNNELSSGDILWIRPSKNGGFAEIGDKIQLYNEDRLLPYGIIKLPWI